MIILKRIRDTFITAAVSTGAALRYRQSLKRKRPLVRAVVFHDVQDAGWFDSCLSLFRDRYNVISPEQFLKKEFHADRINVLITFDDGYASWKEVCLPLLEKHTVKALFFVNSGLIDRHGKEAQVREYMEHKLLISPRRILSWDEVKAIAHAGHTIGGHTVNHVRLSKLSPEMQRHEIFSDKSHIEREIGTEVRMFAYPFGNSRDYTNETKSIVREAGYYAAFTTEGTYIDFKDEFAIARMGIETNATPGSLEQWVEGAYDIFVHAKGLLGRT